MFVQPQSGISPGICKALATTAVEFRKPPQSLTAEDTVPWVEMAVGIVNWALAANFEDEKALKPPTSLTPIWCLKQPQPCYRPPSLPYVLDTEPRSESLFTTGVFTERPGDTGNGAHKLLFASHPHQKISTIYQPLTTKWISQLPLRACYSKWEWWG